jgi:hypothetical protein
MVVFTSVVTGVELTTGTELDEVVVEVVVSG